MEEESVAVYGATALIVATVLVSGPLVSAVDLTQTGSAEGAVRGHSAEVGTVTLPDAATFERGRFGSEDYRLAVPAAIVEFRSIEGRPVLAYRIEIPALNYTRVTTAILSADQTGEFRATMANDALRAERIQRDAYDGRLVLALRGNGTERTLADRPVQIEVSE